MELKAKLTRTWLRSRPRMLCPERVASAGPNIAEMHTDRVMKSESTGSEVPANSTPEREDFA